MSYAGPEYWDGYFRKRRESGEDLDWGGQWTAPFLAPLRDANTRTILELGCGTGNDASRLARDGYVVTAVDVSTEAIDDAQAKFGTSIRFVVADIAVRLPFRIGVFDAVMSNVALHMFPDAITRSTFAEVARVVRPSGLFLFHVNALEDRSLRARRRPIARELERDYRLERCGQAMHFFSERYLRELLRPWREVHLDFIEIAGDGTEQPFKRVWRGEAHR